MPLGCLQGGFRPRPDEGGIPRPLLTPLHLLLRPLLLRILPHLPPLLLRRSLLRRDERVVDGKGAERVSRHLQRRRLVREERCWLVAEERRRRCVRGVEFSLYPGGWVQGVFGWCRALRGRGGECGGAGVERDAPNARATSSEGPSCLRRDGACMAGAPGAIGVMGADSA